MISFKDFLIEARLAPLYHGTPVGNLSIILRNGFQAGTYQTIYKGKNQASWGRYGISLTRNMKNADWYMTNQYRDSEYVVFELDQDAINRRYKIVPVDYFSTQSLLGADFVQNLARAEAEEFVIVPQKWHSGKQEYIGTLDPKYIKAVHYFKNKGPDYDKSIKNAKEKFPQMKWIERRA